MIEIRLLYHTIVENLYLMASNTLNLFLYKSNGECLVEDLVGFRGTSKERSNVEAIFQLVKIRSKIDFQDD